MIVIALSINEGSGESVQMRRFPRAFAARKPRVWIQMKAQTNIKTSSPTEYVIMGVYCMLLRIML